MAERFSRNGNSGVMVTKEQCSNRWKTLKAAYKRIKDHNNKSGTVIPFLINEVSLIKQYGTSLFGATGNGRRECEFHEELSDFLEGRPCVEPVEVAATLDTSLIEDVTDDMANEDDSQRESSTNYCEGSSAKKAKTSIDAIKKRIKSSSKN